jgi:monofunctional biosynthetic peptidoglycan transglycosylase
VKRRAFAFAVGLLVLASGFSALPVAALRFVPPLTSAFMVRAHFGADACDRVEYDWVPREEIAPAVFLAVIAGEDQRFGDHVGFDFDAIGDALEHGREGRPSRGASTITQQVAKNLFLWPGRSWPRKALEAWFTVWIEALWPKARILEVYVNVAQLGRCTFGVAAASRRYFGKEPARLSLGEAALLAAVLPNPLRRRVDAPSPRVRSRAAWIERQARVIARSPWLEGLKASH